MGDAQSSGSPYDRAFKTLIVDCPQLIIPVVNFAFGTTFRGDEKIVFGSTEQTERAPDGQIERREVDSCFTIIGYRTIKVHFECQSTADDRMVVRLWEYDTHIALKDATVDEDGVMELEFPHTAVLYLRHTAKTPDRYRVRMKLRDGRTVELDDMPTIKAQDFSIDEIFDKRLLFLIPFYVFAHEKRLDEYERDAEKLKTLMDEWRIIDRRLADEAASERLDTYTTKLLIEVSDWVLQNLARKRPKVLKEVRELMSVELLDLETKRILDQGREQGREQGQLEGREQGHLLGMLDMCFGLVRKKLLSIRDAAAQLDISEEDFRARYDEAMSKRDK